MAQLQGYQSQTQGQLATDVNRAALAPLQAASSSLTQRLEAMSNMMLENRARSRKIQAGQDALVDVAKYKREISDIRTKYADSPDDMRARLDEAKRGRFKDASTIYGAAYKDQFNSAYSDEVSLDVLEKSSLAEIAAKGNAETYANAMNSYGLEMTRNAPNEELARFTRLSYEKAGIQGFKKLSLATGANTFARDKKMSGETIEALTGIYSQFTQQGEVGEVQAVEILAQANQAIDSAVARGFMSKPMGFTTKQNVIKQGQTQLIKADYNRARESHSEHIYLDELSRNEDMLKLFTPDELNKIMSDIKADMQVRNDLANAEEEEYKVQFEKNKEDAVLKLQKEQVYGTLTIEQIDSAYKMGYLVF